MNWSGWSQFILALVAVGSLISAHVLNKRGSKEQVVQQTAAHELAERAQGFDEMKEIVKELREEISRIEQSRDREAAAQARRCRSVLDHFTLAFVTLQGQVVAEAAKRASEAAQVEAEQHMAEDHPEPID